MKPFLTLFSTLFIALVVAGCNPNNTHTEPAQPEVADATAPTLASPAKIARSDFAPHFTLPSLDGDSLHMADLKGKVVLVNFWATWCGPCRYEIPDLIALQNELGPDDFSVIGISLDEDGPEIVQEFAEALEINYPIAIDNGLVAEAFGGVYALPTTFIIDQAGRISHRTIGLFQVEPFKEDLLTMIDTP